MSGERRLYPERPLVGVMAVVLRGPRALLVRRGRPPMAGRWGFPGGLLELGESLAEGAVRELKEETGVVATPLETLTAVDSIARDGQGRVRVHYVLVAVRALWQEGEGVAGDDAEDVAWLSADEIRERGLPLAPQLLSLIALARARENEESMRRGPF